MAIKGFTEYVYDIGHIKSLHRQLSTRYKLLGMYYTAYNQVTKPLLKWLYEDGMFACLVEISEHVSYLGRCYLLLNGFKGSPNTPVVLMINRLYRPYNFLNEDERDTLLKILLVRNGSVHGLDKSDRRKELTRSTFIQLLLSTEEILNRLCVEIFAKDAERKGKPQTRPNNLDIF